MNDPTADVDAAPSTPDLDAIGAAAYHANTRAPCAQWDDGDGDGPWCLALPCGIKATVTADPINGWSFTVELRTLGPIITASSDGAKILAENAMMAICDDILAVVDP